MDLQILADQLVALRAAVGAVQAQVDAMAAVVDAAMIGAQQVPEPACTHEDSDLIGTLGDPRRKCLRCGAEFYDRLEREAAAAVR